MAAADDQDPYLVLGVARNATAGEIRAAYRTLGAKYHPDRHQGNPLEDLASQKMAEINRAYGVLSDPRLRRAYDEGKGRPGAGARPAGAGGMPDFVARRRASSRAVKLVAVISLLPFAFRFGGLIVRGLVAGGRALMEGLTIVRGTPVVLAAVLLAIVALLLALFRRRRTAARAKPKA
jgi:curved DNA-binding protein CbpA